jgi:hypothetical protein
MPWTEVASAVWSEHDLRAPMLATWEAAGLDAALRGLAVHVAFAASVEAGEEGWRVVDVRTATFGVSERDVVYGVAQYASLFAEEAVALGATRAFSRNERFRHEDLALGAWDALGLARNRAIPPAHLLADARHACAGFHAELSTHPRLVIGDVLAHRDAPWCWYMLSRSPNVTTPEVYRAYRDLLPFSTSGVAVNPAFDDAARAFAGVARPWVCARHGHACLYCTAVTGTCGAPAPSCLPECVSWDVYLRITDDPASAMQRAHDRGVLAENEFADRAVGAYSGAIGNPHISLGLAAWCVAKLRSLGRLGTWVRVTLAANEMRRARADAIATERAAYARIAVCAPAVAQLLRARGVPSSFVRRVLAHMAPSRESVYSVVRFSGTRALVHFECGLRPDASAVWLPATDPFVASRT